MASLLPKCGCVCVSLTYRDIRWQPADLEMLIFPLPVSAWGSRYFAQSDTDKLLSCIFVGGRFVFVYSKIVVLLTHEFVSCVCLYKVHELVHRHSLKMYLYCYL